MGNNEIQTIILMSAGGEKKWIAANSWQFIRVICYWRPSFSDLMEKLLFTQGFFDNKKMKNTTHTITNYTCLYATR